MCQIWMPTPPCRGPNNVGHHLDPFVVDGAVLTAVDGGRRLGSEGEVVGSGSVESGGGGK